jgi:hypothetical protein
MPSQKHPPFTFRKGGTTLVLLNFRRIFVEQSVVPVAHPIVTTGLVRGARERAPHIPDSLAVPS